MSKNNAVYVVGTLAAHGMTLYLSNVGYRSGDHMSYIWEPGFVNARQFLTLKDAQDMVHATGALDYWIWKCSARKDGGFEMTVSYTSKGGIV